MFLCKTCLRTDDETHEERASARSDNCSHCGKEPTVRLYKANGGLVIVPRDDVSISGWIGMFVFDDGTTEGFSGDWPDLISAKVKAATERARSENVARGTCRPGFTVSFGTMDRLNDDAIRAGHKPD